MCTETAVADPDAGSGAGWMRVRGERSLERGGLNGETTTGCRGGASFVLGAEGGGCAPKKGGYVFLERVMLWAT